MLAQVVCCITRVTSRTGNTPQSLPKGLPPRGLPEKFGPLAARYGVIKMPTLTIRLTDSQAEQLEQEAQQQGMTRGSVIKSKFFTGFTPRRVPRPDQKELARLVAELGRVGSNVNQIARHLNRGTIPPSGELVQGIKGAREGIEQIGEQVKAALNVGGGA